MPGWGRTWWSTRRWASPRGARVCPLPAFQSLKKGPPKLTCCSNPPLPSPVLRQRDSPQYQALSVPEHSRPGTVVGNVTGAVDADEGSNAIVYYFIAGEVGTERHSWARKGAIAVPNLHTPRQGFELHLVAACCASKGVNETRNQKVGNSLSTRSWEPGEQLPAEPGGEAAGPAGPGP